MAPSFMVHLVLKAGVSTLQSPTLGSNSMKLLLQRRRFGHRLAAVTNHHMIHKIGPNTSYYIPASWVLVKHVASFFGLMVFLSFRTK